MTDRVFIGPHRLYCGDAYGWFDADVMDPPYLFNNSGGGAFRKARGASDQIVEEALDKGFDHAIINPLLCGAAVVFCHNNQLVKLLAYLEGNFHRTALNVWIKPNPSPMANKHYLADTEFYLVGESDPDDDHDGLVPFIHAWNRGYHPQGEHHDKHRWHTCTSMPSKVFNHPTVKPDSLMNKIMANVNGQTVCDPFMGTGSTGVAAIRAGKTFTGIEQNPAHFETAVRRLRAAYKEIPR